MAPMVKVSLWFITASPPPDSQFLVFLQLRPAAVDWVRQGSGTHRSGVKGNPCLINTRYLCGFSGMFCLLTAYQKAGNERITTENSPTISFCPLCPDSVGFLGYGLHGNASFPLQENSSQEHYGCILLGRGRLLFMIIALDLWRVAGWKSGFGDAALLCKGGKKRRTFGLDFLFPSSIFTLFNKEIAPKEASALKAYIL